jgi:hypothetical protein
MYLRSTSRANKDGSKVRYLALAHNEKVAGVAQAKVLLNLGREDQLDPDGCAGWCPAWLGIWVTRTRTPTPTPTRSRA